MVDGTPQLNRANGRHQLKHPVPAAEGPIVDGAPRLHRANGRHQLFQRSSACRVPNGMQGGAAQAV